VKAGGREKTVQSGFAARLSWQPGMTGVVVGRLHSVRSMTEFMLDMHLRP